ncbi:hypothetical protein K7X08_034606 [Anisodus acutangulus]|uniref:Uncharacterized protein n=1 Tax=Anisodus acutangulus TaxID=402998 RepID=A0A9Q1QZU6_9SOLA|nr:hypothetical protein K7X08_034606 [Anisodus acutangulus]
MPSLQSIAITANYLFKSKSTRTSLLEVICSLDECLQQYDPKGTDSELKYAEKLIESAKEYFLRRRLGGLCNNGPRIFHVVFSPVGENTVYTRKATYVYMPKVESVLIKVGQAPADTMKDALRPVMRAMVSNELLKHADADVKVSVVSCISELSRITAPQQPYDDGLMKEIFQLTVRALEELSHSGRSCHKAVSVLETVADVKACNMLLDLECDVLVIEIFQLFLRIIRPDHPNVVITSMKEILTLLIEESDEISMELLQPFLDSLRKGNQICSPISSKLGEKVLKECVSTVRPCLLEALKSRSMNLDDYAEIVSSICNEMPEGEQMTENENVIDAVKVGPSAAVICETLLEDGTLLNIQMEQLKNTGCRRRAKKKESSAIKDADLADKRNGSLHSALIGDERKGTAGSKRKPRQSSRKSGSVSKGDVETIGGLKIVKREGNLTDAEESSVQQVDEKKQKNDRATIEIQDIEESGDEEIKLSVGDENLSSKLVKTKRRRKLALKKDEDSKRRRFTQKYGEEMVGIRIRVWWPLEEVFYEGAISAFDSVKKKHEITYDDGVIEILNLSKEQWEMLEDNPSDKKHEAEFQCNAVSSVLSTTKKAKRTSSTKKEPGVSSSERSKRNARKSDIESLDIPIQIRRMMLLSLKQQSKTCLVALESSLTLEDHQSDKKHETDLQSNDVSAVPYTKKKAKRTSSIKKERRVSSSKRSKRKAQKSDIGSLDIPIPDKTNDATDVDCETSSGNKEVVDKDDNGITQKQRFKTCESFWMQYVQKHDAVLQSIDVSSVPSKRNAQKSDVEPLDIPTPDKMNDASDVGCETSSGKKELVDKEDESMTSKVALESSLTQVHLQRCQK